MNTILIIFLVLSALLLAVGLRNPGSLLMDKRSDVLMIFGICALICVAALGARTGRAQATPAVTAPQIPLKPSSIPFELIKPGELADKWPTLRGKTFDVLKKNGAPDSRTHDLFELASDWAYYRDTIVKETRAGDLRAAASARSSFQQVNSGLSAYHDKDVSFAIGLAEQSARASGVYQITMP